MKKLMKVTYAVSFPKSVCIYLKFTGHGKSNHGIYPNISYTLIYGFRQKQTIWEIAVHLAVACGVYDDVFFPRDVLDEILNLIESVSEGFEGFPTYSNNNDRKTITYMLDSQLRR